MTEIRPIRESDAAAFHAAVDAVCRERRFLATLEGPPLEKTTAFVTGNVKNGLPQFVADKGGLSAGAMRFPEMAAGLISADLAWEC